MPKNKTLECCGGVGDNHATDCWALQAALVKNVRNKNRPVLVERLKAVAEGNTLPYGRNWLDEIRRDCGTAAELVVHMAKREGHCRKWHFQASEGEVNERLKFLEEENEYLRAELRKLRGEANGNSEGADNREESGRRDVTSG